MTEALDLLACICAAKRKHVAACQRAVPMSVLVARAKASLSVTTVPLGLAAALDQAVNMRGYGLIAEIKKASPSRGVIRSDFNPPVLAKEYAAGGAACLSIVTDQPYFQGDDAFISKVRTVVTLPILRKDFILDPYQVVEARALGADAILIILAAVSDSQAIELEATAMEFGLDVLAEVHNEGEIERALYLLNTRLIGVNNRDLRTLSVDLTVTERLSNRIPLDRVVVAESGLSQAEDLARLSRIGVHRFLIGESLMRQPNVIAATQTILAVPKNKPKGI